MIGSEAGLILQEQAEEDRFQKVGIGLVLEPFLQFGGELGRDCLMGSVLLVVLGVDEIAADFVLGLQRHQSIVHTGLEAVVVLAEI